MQLTNDQQIIINMIKNKENIITINNEFKLTGVVPDFYDEIGMTPLMYAAVHNNYELIQLLLKDFSERCLINHQNKFKYSALMLASENGHHESIKELMKHPRIDYHLVNSDGQTVLMLSIDKITDECLKELLKYPKHLLFKNDNEGNNIFTYTVINNDLEKFKLLMNYCEDNSDGQWWGNKNNELMIAVKNNNYQFVKLLCNYTIYTDNYINIINECGNSILYYAVKSTTDINILKKLLILENIDINIQNYNGVTPLMRAVVNDGNIPLNQEKIKLLLKAGADPNIKNYNGMTIMDYSKKYKRYEDLFDEHFKKTNKNEQITLIEDKLKELVNQLEQLKNNE